MDRLQLLTGKYIFLIWGILFFSCNPSAPSNEVSFQGDRKNDEPQIDPPDSLAIPPAPVLSPEEALASFHIEPGFSIDLIASEPDIRAPVAIEFDERGRMWVLEMYGYMSDLRGTDEESKSGRIVILTDTDRNGTADQAKVFLDSLVLPRAHALVYGGLLYAEPPNLWFQEILAGDKPGEKVLVDSVYAVGGNVEHQPNTLLLAMDNWIYSAKSRYRYRRVNGNWIKQETEFRGQWGITQDDQGRLFYNTNSNQLRGDLVWPNTMMRNANFLSKLGTNREIAHDQRVYPIRVTPGVNRGYRSATLDETFKLQRFTAACGPLIYRGTNFSSAYYQNAFVAEPAGNLIKRNLLSEKNARIYSQQAYYGKEFLASTDERFRPVNLYNAPDGSMYVLDMYRGIVQHKTYMTGYLYRQVVARGLDQPVNLGRIYRIKSDHTPLEPIPDLSLFSTEELVELLSHPNAWHREKAQQLLVEGGVKEEVISILEGLIGMKAGELAAMHSLWVLEGWNRLSPEHLQLAFNTSSEKVVATAIRLGEVFSRTPLASKVLDLYNIPLKRNNTAIQLQLALGAGAFRQPEAIALLETIAQSHDEDPLIREAVVSSLGGEEEMMMRRLVRDGNASPNTVALLTNILNEVENELAEVNLALDETEQVLFDQGRKLYEHHCSGCHQYNGKGMEPLAPPLVRSEYVLGNEKSLILVALHGLTGPVTVNGVVYEPPKVQAQMPGLKDNPSFSDEKIAAVLSYVRNAWGNRGSFIDQTKVATIRKETAKRSELITEKELQAMGLLESTDERLTLLKK